MTVAQRLAYTFFRHAATEKYPTRSVEHMLAWMIVVWGVALAIPGVNMQGPTFKYLVAIAPEWWWSLSGFLLGTLRLIALFLNGGWRRSPGLRFFGAATGMIWWVVLSASYWLAIQNGAPDFPMRYVLFVPIFFEAYSCYRCGQDHTSPRGGADGG